MIQIAPDEGDGRRDAAGSRSTAETGGFTLLELVVILALLTLIMGLVLPGLTGVVKRERDRANLRQLATLLRAARSEAAVSHQRVRVFLNLDNQHFALEGTSLQGQLTGMRVGEVHLVWQDQFKRQGYIAFYGDGSSSGGKLAVMDQTGRRYLLEVEIITGRVSLRAEES